MLSAESLRCLDEVQERLICEWIGRRTAAGVHEPQTPPRTPWLQQTYPQIFTIQSFYEHLSEFFNCNPPEMSPALFKTLLFAIIMDLNDGGGGGVQAASGGEDRATDPKMEFLNTVQDVVPCIVRWEVEEEPLLTPVNAAFVNSVKKYFNHI